MLATFDLAALTEMRTIFMQTVQDFRAPYVQAYSMTESPVVRDLVFRINANISGGNISGNTVYERGTPTLRDAFVKMLDSDVVKAYVHATFDTMAKATARIGNIESAVEYDFMDDVERELPNTLAVCHLAFPVILASMRDHLPVKSAQETGALDQFLADIPPRAMHISQLAQRVLDDNQIDHAQVREAYEVLLANMKAASTAGIESIYPRNLGSFDSNPF
jgi:hypothetical protein